MSLNLNLNTIEYHETNYKATFTGLKLLFEVLKIVSLCECLLDGQTLSTSLYSLIILQ